MHFGISEGKGGLKHESRPWLGMDIFWNCPILTCEDIDDFSDIRFVSYIQDEKKFVGVSSKHLLVFLESQSSDIFGNFRKFSENVRERSSGLRDNLENLWKSSESGRKIFGSYMGIGICI